MLSVRAGGRDAGTATPHHITRHSHPKARPEPLPGDDAPRATGIDYLALLGEQHDRQAAARVNYAALVAAAPATAAGGPGDRQRKTREEKNREAPVADSPATTRSPSPRPRPTRSAA